MTTVRSPAATECVIDPVSRSPAGRLDLVAAASAVAADAALVVGAADAVAASSARPGLMPTSGRVQPASPALTVSATPRPSSPFLTLRADMAQPSSCGARRDGQNGETARRRTTP